MPTLAPPVAQEALPFYPTAAALRCGDEVLRLAERRFDEPQRVVRLDGFYESRGYVHLAGVAEPVEVSPGDRLKLAPPF